MNQIPDLTGYIYEDAENILREAGIKYVSSETSSPRNDVEGEEKRIVRHIVKDGVVHLTWCRY